jgi:hypothetical protein
MTHKQRGRLMEKSATRYRPDCYKCRYKRQIRNDAHIKCVNKLAKVQGNFHGEDYGWFKWPSSFDPIWLESCNSFAERVKTTGKRKATV